MMFKSLAEWRKKRMTAKSTYHVAYYYHISNNQHGTGTCNIVIDMKSFKNKYSDFIYTLEQATEKHFAGQMRRDYMQGRLVSLKLLSWSLLP